MCGIFGIAGPDLPDDQTVARLRDLMSHRGPDGVGLWRAPSPGPGLVLAHRRLAVIDPSPAGHQPMTRPDGSALVYNGELYNDAELRDRLASHGARFTSRSDAETVLEALALWGASALRRLRGMYALAWFDAPRRRLILARDPLGIKPLFYRFGPLGHTRALIFASDIRAILAHPAADARPDLTTISAYLTTIRTTLAGRTLFDGVRTLQPGEVLTFDLSADEPRIAARDRIIIAPGDPPSLDVRTTVEDSIVRHLRSDAPTCCLLSGGLDSTIIASVARRHADILHTYCSGALAPRATDDPPSDDFAFARQAAAFFGTQHTEAPITRALFAERWPWMIETLGQPLSTPNEVAIHEVSRRLRADGRIVALSGEGADELFGGYDAPLSDAAAFVSSGPDARSTARFLLDSAAWVPTAAKPALLSPDLWRALEADSALIETYSDEFAAAAAERGNPGPPDPLGPFLRFHRRVNLTGLLARLDSAAMLAGVEGRTPFADSAVAALAESLPMHHKFAAATPNSPARTKIALREAFAANLPPGIASRPKASFPLPFQDWIEDHASALTRSDFARAIFTPAAIASVAARPRELWRFAWPMLNIAMWGRHWWG